jgi:RES domain-containing protein
VGVGVIYASLTPETAMAETLAHNRYYQIPVEDAMPRMFVAMEANLQRVLDLSKGDVRSRLKVSLERILKVDWRREAREGRVPVTYG